MQIDALMTYNLAPAIARIPRMPRHQTQPPRPPEQYITFHYSAVVYSNRSQDAELARVIDEAKFHIQKNWGSAAQPIYGDGYQYDCVILSSGAVVRTRDCRVQLWHAGNATANACSWSVHVMLGKAQAMTPLQAASVARVFDALRADSDIPRQNVIAHCEWPRVNGLPVRSTTYRLLPGQSECPGATLFPFLVDYRARVDVPTMPSVPQIDPFAEWGDGVPRPQGDQRGWAIPRVWLMNKGALGACRAAEFYPPPLEDVSVAVFERGSITYIKATDRAIVTMF